MQLKKILLNLPRNQKRTIAVVFDVACCIFTVWFSFYLRTGVFHALHRAVLISMIVSVALAIPIFALCGLYRAVFRYEGIRAAVAICEAHIIYGTLYCAIFTLCVVPGVPRTIGLIQPVFLFALISLSRGIARFWLGDEYRIQLKNSKIPSVLIYGAGDAGRQLLSVLETTRMVRVEGFIDDNPNITGLFISGVKVYSGKELEALVKRKAVRGVLLAIPSAPTSRRKEIIEKLSELQVEVRTLPALSEIASGQVTVNSLKHVSIEDLLGRDPVKPIDALVTRTITGKVVMVTGAGGSIGSELSRLIVRVGAKTLLLVERSEFALYAIHTELTEKLKALGVEVVPLLADVRDEERIREIIKTWDVQTIYHAAAYKHVPMVEKNPMEGIINNVFGTWTVARVARECGVEKFILISTDKAVRPTNIMGASKRLCELILQSMAASNPRRTIFTMVRFGNVLGSSGSVVPRFREQIANGGPVTVTHKDIIRYFMTIPEAALLVVQAASMGQGGEVFLLDMGEPVRIMDLAKRMIKLSGKSIRDAEHPKGDIEIQVTGLRPGEKTYEELLVDGNPSKTEHPRIFYAKEVAKPREDLLTHISELKAVLESRDRNALRKVIKDCVPEYAPKTGIVDCVCVEEERISGEKVSCNL